jgi:hypothetical protein
VLDGSEVTNGEVRNSEVMEVTQSQSEVNKIS